MAVDKVVTSLKNVTRYSENPLLMPNEIKLKHQMVKSQRSRELIDPVSGEIHGVHTVMIKKVVDSERFAKIYLDGVGSAFELGSPARKVFKVILKSCMKDSDRLYLHFMDVEHVDGGMSEKTFQRGLKELIQKNFLAADVRPAWYWINPHIFFNGDRVRFLTEYVKEKTITQQTIEN